MGGMGSGVGLGLGQPFYGVVPVGAQLVQPDFMARYPALPPDHRFRGPKKVCACAFFHGYVCRCLDLGFRLGVEEPLANSASPRRRSRGGPRRGA